MSKNALLRVNSNPKLILPHYSYSNSQKIAVIELNDIISPECFALAASTAW